MARFLRTIAAVLRYLVPLVGQAFVYWWRWTLDLITAARAAVIIYKRRRAPAEASDLNGRLARLRERRALRWLPWQLLTPRRRWEVRAAAVVVFIAGAVGLRSYVVSDATPSPAPPAHRSAPVRQARDLDAAREFAHALQSTPAKAWVRSRDLTAALAPGPLGAWDDFKVGSPIVIAEHSIVRGTTYRLWYRGCQLLDEYVCGVGNAESSDGIAWTRRPEPVFVPADAFDREHLDAIAIAHGPGGYVLWYSVAPSWFNGHRRASLHAARSSDGLTWTPLPGVAYEATAQGARLLPSAAFDGARYHLWVFDSQVSIDPATGLFPPISPEGDEVLRHFVSIDGTRIDPAGATPASALRVDPAALSISYEAASGFQAVFYEQRPMGPQAQGLAALRSQDGSVWIRSDAESLALPIGDLGADASTASSVAALRLNGGLFAWIAVRGKHGSEAVRALFYKETA